MEVDSYSLLLNPNRLAFIEDNSVTNITILMLLAGISMAAIIGDRLPCTAKESPTKLYRMDNIKLIVTIFLPDFAYARK